MEKSKKCTLLMARGVIRLTFFPKFLDKDVSLFPNGQREETCWIEGKIGKLKPCFTEWLDKFTTIEPDGKREEYDYLDGEIGKRLISNIPVKKLVQNTDGVSDETSYVDGERRKVLMFSPHQLDRDLVIYPDGKREETYWYEGEIRKLVSARVPNL